MPFKAHKRWYPWTLLPDRDHQNYFILSVHR